MSQRQANLQRKGIAFFVIDGVLARLTKKQSSDALRAAQAVPVVQLGAVLAKQVKERVTRRGKLSDRQPATRYGQKSRVELSQEYARAAGLNVRQRAKLKNEDVFHRALRSPVGSYVVSGGMWSGMEVRGSGRDAAIIDFAGRSEGRGKRTLQARNIRTKGGQTFQRKSYVMKPQQVPNRDKAGRVWRFHRVNVLDPTEAEIKRIALIRAQSDAERAVAALAGTSYNPRWQALGLAG